MKTVFKRIFLFAYILLFLLASFYGCGTNVNPLSKPQPAVSTPEGTAVTLRIITDKSMREFRMNDLLEDLAASYEELHENVSFEIEYLSDEKEERESQLDRLRTEMLAGDGPDIFLLSGRVPIQQNEPLFVDVEQSMYNGMFHDLSAYYNADTELKTEEFNETIMAAGTIGEARYILPFYYDLPVIQVNEAALGEYGLTIEDVTTGMDALIEKVVELNDPFVSGGLATIRGDFYFLFDYFPNLIDYEKKELQLTEEELTTFMQVYQQWMLLRANAGPYANEINSLNSYVQSETAFWHNAGFPFHLDNMANSLACAAMGKLQGEEFAMYPMRASDGSVIASVTYWGAVGAGCKYPDVAYDFLREFLTQETQWEANRNQLATMNSGSLYCEMGIPVRTDGMVSELYSSMLNQIQTKDLDAASPEKQREVQLKDLTLENSDFPMLETEIDQVRFYNHFECNFMYQLNSLNDWKNNFVITDVDIEATAKEIIENLEYLLAEG